MTTLRDALLARLAEIREAAEAGSPTPWTTRNLGRHDLSAVVAYHAAPGNLIASLGPYSLAHFDARVIVLARNLLGPLVEGLAEEVGRHEGPVGTTYGWLPGCRICGVAQPGVIACSFVRRWADRLGVTVEEGT